MLRKQPYDKTVDWWCLGAVLYEMMYGLVGFGLLTASSPVQAGARCSSVVRAFAHGAMGRRIDPGGPIELFLVPASAPRLTPYNRK